MDNKTKAALIKAALIIGGAILFAVLLYTLFHPLHIKIVSENVIKLIPFNMWNHGSVINNLTSWIIDHEIGIATIN